VSVCRADDGVIVLEGECSVEDAESVLQLLQAQPAGPLDWTLCRYLHTAPLQVILAARPTLIGPCGDAWVERWISSKPV
jgi:hypothetical protein